MGVLVRFKLRNGSIDNRVMGAAVLNDRIGSRNIFAEKNLMIIKSVRNVVAQGKSDKLTENDRQKSLRNKNELPELKSRNQGGSTLATRNQR